MTENEPKPNPKASAGFLGIFSSVGGTVLGHYQVLEQIGHGGMGQVYKARDLRLGRTVALKFLPPWKRGDSDERRQLEQEAKCASALNHPNIITVYEIAEYNSVNFIVMEYVVGDTLERLIPHVGLPITEALGYAVEIADALAAAHGAGILHGDLKPGNIMVTRQGRIKLLDFGLARELTAWPSETSDEEMRQRLGTTIWLAPEQLAQPPVPLDPRSEVFSFGLIMHQMLSGGHPFGSGERENIKAALLTGDPRALAGAPSELAAIIQSCLRKDIGERFQSMQEVLIALKAFPGVKHRGPSDARSTDRGAKHAKIIAGKISYKNVARSRRALRELTNLLGPDVTPAIRHAISSVLRDLILNSDLGGDEGRPAARVVRKLTLDVLRTSTGGDLSTIFDAEDFEHLDLYGMDFSASRFTGVRFNGCFLVKADFHESDLSRTSFAGTWLRNVDFTGANLAGADFTDADWFNVSGLNEHQLRSVQRETLTQCPSDVNALRRLLDARYGYSYDSWGLQIQNQLQVTWAEYLRPGGLRDLVAEWQQPATDRP